MSRSERISLVPTGLGHTKPHHYRDMVRIAWRNRDQLPYAWRILTRGVCDGCALGTTGLHDFTIEGVHLCMVRLELLRMNTAPALDERVLENADEIAKLNSQELRELGRLPFPMLRLRGDRGFRRISWDEAITYAGDTVARTDPRRVAIYLTSRGLTNEAYYVTQKVARFLGTNNVDNSARICHSPSTVALKSALGVPASTCSYSDWIGSDLLVFFGSNTPNTQPVTTKYIYEALKKGTKVVVVNPYREPGLERYWIPSIASSALFGTKIAEDFFHVNINGDRAFIAGVIKHLIEQSGIDNHFVNEYTEGFDVLKSGLNEKPWEELEAASGANRDEMLRFASILSKAQSAVFVWSMGITQHHSGVSNVRAIIDLALSRGFIGRAKSGLMAIRGHSGVQGGSEVGAVPYQFPGGVAVDETGAAQMHDLWGFDVPATRGLNAVEMIDAAARGEIDWFYQIGGNFLETLPEPDYVREAVARIPDRIAQDIVLSPHMFVEPRDTVLLLPARTRYEQRGGGTETTTERRIIFSPEIPGRRIGEARSEWEIPMLIAERAKPRDSHLIHFEDSESIRREISAAVPFYSGIENLREAGDAIQWGGNRLCEDANGRPHFGTANGRAKFSAIEIDEPGPLKSNGRFRLATRRGKQFNSMIQNDYDPLTGAKRDHVFISRVDAEALGLGDGDPVVLRSDIGEFRGRCRLSPITPGNLEVHWPEGNVLVKRGIVDAECGIPDFNATVTIEAATEK
jgi:molybdopterin-dependent oxidoreductase alpha subunit